MSFGIELVLSSGDSVGVSVNDQRARFNDLANRRPSTALTLQHEVQRKSLLGNPYPPVNDIYLPIQSRLCKLTCYLTGASLI